MYQVSPEDQLQVVRQRQGEWRAESARESEARTAPALAASRRSKASRVEGRSIHQRLAHAAQLLHALAPRHGTRRARPSH